MERSVREIAERPEMGSPHLAGTRRVLTRRFPYSVIYLYQAREERLVVVAVAHHRRKPSYWLRRL